MSRAYPTLDEVLPEMKVVVNAIRTKNVGANVPALVKAAYDVEGYAISMIVGEPSEQTGRMAMNPEQHHELSLTKVPPFGRPEDIATHLQAFIDAHESPAPEDAPAPEQVEESAPDADVVEAADAPAPRPVRRLSASAEPRTLQANFAMGAFPWQQILRSVVPLILQLLAGL